MCQRRSDLGLIQVLALEVDRGLVVLLQPQAEACLVDGSRDAAEGGDRDVVARLFEGAVGIDELGRPQTPGVGGAVLERPCLSAREDEKNLCHRPPTVIGCLWQHRTISRSRQSLPGQRGLAAVHPPSAGSTTPMIALASGLLEEHDCAAGWGSTGHGVPRKHCAVPYRSDTLERVRSRKAGRPSSGSSSHGGTSSVNE
jgi:hypothetical protein